MPTTAWGFFYLHRILLHSEEMDAPAQSTTKQRLLLWLVFVVSLLLAIMLPRWLREIVWYNEQWSSWPYGVRSLVNTAWRLLAVFVGWWVMRSLLASQDRPTLGLRTSFRRGIKSFALGCACTLPMLILGLLGDREQISSKLIYSTIVAGLSEEIIYRAFAFGLMVQVFRVKLWPAAVVSGVIFALAHLNVASVRAMSIDGLIFWLALIALGGVMYAWIYARSGWSLWIVIALHSAMNLWWGVFDLSSSPLGSWGATMVRILSVGLAVYFVVFRSASRSPPDDAETTIRA
tara:strand:+ start:126644 stop:127513 length:870 start_codon:yes stop_codon:yes gene_type:complete